MLGRLMEVAAPPRRRGELVELVITLSRASALL